jgi:hypothetical protein
VSFPEIPVEDGVVNGVAVFERDHAQNPRVDFFGSSHFSPEPDTAVRLNLALQRGSNDGNTPALIDVGSFAKYLLLEYRVALMPRPSIKRLRCA